MFFRYQSDGFVFPIFSPLHGIFLLIAFLGVCAIFRWPKTFRQRPYLRYCLASALLIIQLLLYAWFWGGDAYLQAQGWPLYHCRVAELSMLLTLFFNFSWAKDLSVYLGLYGSVFALLIPVMEPFSFPHVTNVAYFAAHLLMLWTVAYLIVILDYRFTSKGLIHSLIFLNLFNLSLLWLNPLLGMNYAYFSLSPIFTGFFNTWPRILYVGLLLALYNALVLLTHVGGRKLTLVYRQGKNGEM